MSKPELPELPNWNFSVKETQAYALSYGRACMEYAADIVFEELDESSLGDKVARKVRKAAEELK